MKLINPDEIRFVGAPIAPILARGSVHYEWIAFQDEVNQIPRIEAEPVKHAHWFTLDPNPRTGKAYKFACSNCERVVFTHRQESVNELGYVFCPHCGAKMNEEMENKS